MRASVISVLTVMLCILAPVRSVPGQDRDAGFARDHPVIARMPGSYIAGYTAKESDRYRFLTDDGYVSRNGFLHRIEYRFGTDVARRDAPEILGNYIDDIRAKGGTVLYESGSRATLSVTVDDGEIWIEVIARERGYEIVVVEQRDPWVTASAGERARALKPRYEIAADRVIARRESEVATDPGPVLRPPLVTYYVSADAGEDGDGTEENPFGSIRRALENAADHKAMQVHVFVGAGTYAEDVEITRATKIAGLGCVPVIRGSIANTWHDLTLEDLSLSEASGRAIRQTGGTLRISECTVSRTACIVDDPVSGRAVDLSGGTVATLTDVTINDNGGHALLLGGAGTKAICSRIQVMGNRVNPRAREEAIAANESSRTGAVEVTDGAKLLMEDFTVENNEFNGILVLYGGLAHLRDGTISRTALPGGNNIGLFGGAKLEVHRVVTSEAGSCGIRMFCSYLRVDGLTFRDNPIAIAYQTPPESSYDLMACLYEREGNVTMENNGINFDSFELAVPNVLDYIEDEQHSGEGPFCPGVPWE